MGSEGDNFPDEIICKIFSFLNPIDVIRTRLVSKRMRNITYDHELWKILYTNARFPRPPGPFSYQSTQSLERVLVRSARLAETWTAQPMVEVSSSEIRVGLGAGVIPELACGRWIIECEHRSKIVSHDSMIQTPNGTPLREVILEPENGAKISLQRFFTIPFMEAETVYIVVFSRPVTPKLSFQPLLLEFRPNGDSLGFCSSLSIPFGEFNSNTRAANGGNGPFLFIQDLCVVFDTRTRIFYALPPFSTQLDGIQAQFLNPRRVLLSDTYIIVFTYSVVGGPRNSVLVQAFTPRAAHPPLPPEANGLFSLQLTHECIGVPDSTFLMIPARGSTIDSSNGSTNLRFLGLYDGNHKVTVCYADFKFISPKPHDDSVLPISFEIHDTDTAVGPFSILGNPYYIFIYVDEAGGDGYVRGYYHVHELDGDDHSTQEYRHIITKFTIDATQERCRAVVGEPSVLDKCNHVTKPVVPAWFDGARGRICYGVPVGQNDTQVQPVQGYSTLHVVDIQ